MMIRRLTIRRLTVRSLLAALLLLVAASAGAQVLDRTIAVVNHKLVTWSELDAEMRFEALENHRPLAELTEADRRAAFERLVQQRIVREQMQNVVPATDSECTALLAEMRSNWSAGQDDAAWAAVLKRYGLSADEVRQMVGGQIEVLRFIEDRMRPLARVNRKEVEDYYHLTLAPQVAAKGGKLESYEELAPKIQELLSEQKMSDETEKWLKQLREQANVQIIWEAVRAPQAAAGEHEPASTKP